MRKLLGVTVVIGLGAASFLFFPRVSTTAVVVREIPVAAIAGDRSPASFNNSAAHFSINSAILGQMENSKEHLREFAKAEPTAGGWTIHILPGDKIFAKSGIHDGDKISLETVRTQAENAHQPILADRFIDILRQIED